MTPFNIWLWPPTWLKACFVILLLSALNLFGLIFFGYGFFAALFLSGLLSTMLWSNTKTNIFRLLVPVPILLSSILFFQQLHPFKDDPGIVFAYACLVPILFIVGALLGAIKFGHD